MENTIENKAKFFALYWGQKCAWTKLPHENEYLGKVSAYSIMWTTYLELTPLSSISDEDAIEVLKMYGRRTYKTDSDTIKGRIKSLGYLDTDKWDYFPIGVWDYLRSRGYALPFMGLSVEELVNRGWVKLKGGQYE